MRRDPDGRKVYCVYAASGGPPAPIPNPVTPESVNEWAAKCQDRYRYGAPTPGVLYELHRQACRLWLNREMGWKDAARVARWITGPWDQEVKTDE